MDWHKPEDQLPTDRSRVLAVVKGEIHVAWYGHHDERWRVNDRYCHEPSHWSPLPEVPHA